MSKDLLIIENISKTFKVDKNKELQALKNINIRLKKGECIGIVGESGCGKSTLARIIVGIERKTSGKIIFDNKEIEGISKTKDIQMIFQNPLSSFNPRMKIVDYMWEPLRNYFKLSKKDSIPFIKKSLINLLEKGLITTIGNGRSTKYEISFGTQGYLTKIQMKLQALARLNNLLSED